MRLGNSLLSVGLAALLSLVPAIGQTRDLPNYRPAKLSEALAKATFAKAPNNGKPTYSYEGAPEQYKFIVTVTYTGKIRKIPPTRLDLISKWGKAMHAEDFTGHFDQEIEVRADGLTVWLALQDVLVQFFSREVKTGARVELWIMYIGAVQPVGAAQPDRVFLVNEFQAVK